MYLFNRKVKPFHVFISLIIFVIIVLIADLAVNNEASKSEQGSAKTKQVVKPTSDNGKSEKKRRSTNESFLKMDSTEGISKSIRRSEDKQIEKLKTVKNNEQTKQKTTSNQSEFTEKDLLTIEDNHLDEMEIAILRTFNVLDNNENDLISFDEYKNAGGTRLAFNKMDINQDNMISEKEMIYDHDISVIRSSLLKPSTSDPKPIEQHYEALSQISVNDIISAYDKNEDLLIDRKEFVFHDSIFLRLDVNEDGYISEYELEWKNHQ